MAALFSVDSFITDQYSSYSPQSFLPHTPNAKIVAYQLGNLYGLMALTAFFALRLSSEPAVVQNTLMSLAIADIGHVGSCYVGMGASRFLDVSNWNAMAWGNIAITSFLFVSRVSYLLGLFDGRTTVKTKIR